MYRIIKDLLSDHEMGETVVIKGWVKAFRQNRFIIVNDGSTIRNVQAVVDLDNGKVNTSDVHVGCSISLKGQLVPSQGKGQEFDLLVDELAVLGKVDPEEIQETILQPKRHSLEKLREQAHLRFRTNTFGAVFRMRHAMTYAIHKFFHDRGFFSIHSPIITGSDAEGAGEMFRVTTLEAKSPPLTEEGEVDFTKDFFGKETNLTVSGQLEAELGALALGKVYTFGPTFRAENSNTTRHAAEFWMIEPEVAFADIHDNMDLAEEMLQYLCKYALEHCADDLAFLDERFRKEEESKPQNQRAEHGLIERLEMAVNEKYERITYTEAIEILHNSKPYKKKKFKFPVEWGVDLQSEHERYLVEKHFKKPVIITAYPKSFKAFYMRNNDDGKTVAAMDVLFPSIGEIIGGSQREERLDVLKEKIKDFHIPEESVWWYLDTRKFGTVPHSGYGLGFERLLMYVTGMHNIRDVIPFPRTPKNAEF